MTAADKAKLLALADSWWPISARTALIPSKPIGKEE